MNVFLIRHTAVYNPKNVCYGQSEMPLEENFTSKFSFIEEKLKDYLNADSKIISSPLKRCLKLASYLKSDDYSVDERIMELNFGTWELLNWEDIPKDELNEWMKNFDTYKINQGESFKELHNRTISFWKDILKIEEKNIFIITHAGVIRSILAHILKFPLKNAFKIAVDNHSITHIQYQKEYKSVLIKSLNITS